MTPTPTSADDTTTHRFRAPTVDAALADARAELGDVEIVEANRIRRGGVGGFFATDLGVELVVRPPQLPTSTATDVADAEYVDSTDVGDTSRLPRASGRDDRPPFYDRVREETSPPAAARPTALPTQTTGSITAELERILDVAARAERPPRSFASHLAEHLAEREPAAATPEPAAQPIATPAPEPAEVLLAEPAARPPGPATTPSSSRRKSAASRDPWRRSVDLAAGAVGRLVEQLSDVTPVAGSRMQTLSRLTISVTTPDGAVIELTAELEGDA